MLTITNKVIRSPYTQHTANRTENWRWRVSWLPRRSLTERQARDAMMIAHLVGKRATDAGPETYSLDFWDTIDFWAKSLRMTGATAVAKVSDPPGEA